MELILTDIELGIDVQNEELNSFDVWWNKKQNVFVAVNPITKENYRYELTKPIEDILYDDSDEILRSRLSKITKEDEVGIADIFMYGKHVKQIK
jgi:hypothetical protein